MTRTTVFDWIDTGLRDVGADGLTVERMCKEMNRTKGWFYHHFPDVESFQHSVLAQWRAAQTRTPIDALAGAPSNAPALIGDLLRTEVPRLDHRLAWPTSLAPRSGALRRTFTCRSAQVLANARCRRRFAAEFRPGRGRAVMRVPASFRQLALSAPSWESATGGCSCRGRASPGRSQRRVQASPKRAQSGGADG